MTTIARALENDAVLELSKSFDGVIIGPADRDYEGARQAWNAMIDRRPALIAQARGTADVAAAVRFARKHQFEIAIRGGGHSTSGQSVTDGGVVIDLRLMRGVRVDPSTRRAWVQGGCLLADVDREAQLHGLATTGGVVSHTGVGGLTLGGGYGYLARAFGLACDNVLSAEVVTASGTVLAASPDENPDLYWGLRGGGGNFGVVTGFEFALHPFGPDILSVDMAYPIDDGPNAMRALFELAADSPETLVTSAGVVTGRPMPLLPDAYDGQPIVWVSYTYAGDVERGKRYVSRLRAAGAPIVETIEIVPYMQLQRAADERQRHGLRQYARSHFLRSTPHAFVDAFLARAGKHPGIAANGSIMQLGGAIGRVGAHDSPFSGRDALYDFVVSSTWEDAAEDDDRLAAGRAYADAILPLSTGRSYVNAIEAGEPDKVRAAFGRTTYDRLAAVKARYDPDNVFHLNQNVRPAAPS